MANFPHELVDEILLWLPAKSLLRFKCLCKSFHAIIGTQSFINSNFKRSSENRIHRKQIDLGLDKTKDYRWKIRALEFNDDFEKELVLEKPYPSKVIGPPYFSYCNGLVLLYIDKFSIWNPSTRKYRILPDFPGLMYTGNIFSFGLGYDSTTDDYKVVLIISKYNIDIEEYDDTTHVWIFELRSSHWRRIQDFPYVDYKRIDDGGNGDCFVDGALHFICHHGDELDIIVAFDVTKETFSVVHESGNPIEVNRYDLSVFRGCLSMCQWNITMGDGDLDIYVRKKEGVAFTWTKLYSVTTQQFPYEGFDLFEYGGLVYSKGGDKVFVSSYGKLYSYDLKEKTLQEIATMNTDYIIFPRYIFSCTESLVSVGS